MNAQRLLLFTVLHVASISSLHGCSVRHVPQKLVDRSGYLIWLAFRSRMPHCWSSFSDHAET